MLSDLELWEVGTAVAAVLIVAAVAITAVDMTATGPEIREGSFVADTGDGLFAVGARSCSTDSDCEPTTCAGDDYMIDTDSDVACTDHDGDGDTECTGYDESYSDAEYCGGRYDYNCDSSSCEGYKAACEDDCGANSVVRHTVSAAAIPATMTIRTRPAPILAIRPPAVRISVKAS